ncbi:hypothetical protein B0H11DRAFT_2420758 [Mycena galericulata]|nr:hypothetical protein B0H11DRAFT_2420758 [Mycena galericulata]
MSDPAVLSFTPPAFPELHFDNTGRAWLRDANGQFSLAPSAPQARPNVEQDSTAAGPAQSGVQPAAYNFPPSFGAASSYRPQPLIDPSLLRLPEDNDFDLSDPSTIAKARGLKPAKKGRRVSEVPVTKKGCCKGTPNYNKDDTNKLLDIIEKKRPLGQKGARNLSDSDVDDGDDLSSDAESVEVLDAKPSDIHTAVARRAPTPPLRRNPRMNAPELVNKLAQAFDPEVQKSRDDERTQRSFQNTQIFTLSQQLRDTQATVESLRNQITVMQNRTHDVERARDCAEFMLEVYEGRVSGHVKQERRMQRYRDHPDIVRVNSSARYPSSDSEKENRDPSSPHPRFLERPPSHFDLDHSSSSGPFQLHHHDKSTPLAQQPSIVSSALTTPGPSHTVADPSTSSHRPENIGAQ